MKSPSTTGDTSAMYSGSSLAFALGLFLLVEGIWGFFRPVVFGVLTTNHLHASIHVVLGIAGIWSSSTGRARGFLLFVGALLALVGALWFVPVARDLVINLFAVNKAVALVNLVIGTISLLVVFNVGRLEQMTDRRW